MFINHGIRISEGIPGQIGGIRQERLGSAADVGRAGGIRPLSAPEGLGCSDAGWVFYPPAGTAMPPKPRDIPRRSPRIPPRNYPPDR